MRICLILEGSYPYIRGGVSSWTQGYIKAMPEHEFVLWLIGSKAEEKGNYVYEFPDNVVEVREVFLDEPLRIPAPKEGRKTVFTEEEFAEHRKLLRAERPNLKVLAHLYNTKNIHINEFLMSETFLTFTMNLCQTHYPYVPLTEFFHSLRSMLLPMLYMISQDIPEADVYHAVSTGYAGLLGSLASTRKQKTFVLTEHGIYTREQEEEIIRADWISPYLKQLWIDFFYMLADIAYTHATSVTTLFERAKKTQEELGASAEKTKVIRNGIHANRLAAIPLKEPDGYIDIGAIVRFHPIKDIKTMIYAFYELKRMVPNARLHIVGGVDDEEYYQECLELIRTLDLKDIQIPGVVNVLEYMEKLDFTVLSSISKGQPLSLLESFAARRPCVTTDVGNCRELISGEETDSFGPAGFTVPPLDTERMAEKMEQLCKNRTLRIQMGENGQKRVRQYYIHHDMIDHYIRNYKEVLQQ
ncbi:GT4 family glycosyltransferase PelF [Atopococcus tabaci]|uniref:GT4 family glycosyltransferase PelF n=1 Tax=Atopococcus tabaci TaxID=269774 RepID=UPI002408F592|nr:GT4 family glycosyltransferase PelF [Atopococcus tabaci]